MDKVKYKTSDKILDYLKLHSDVGPSELAYEFDLGRAVIHRHLKKFQEQGLVYKTGVPPKVFYSAFENISEPAEKNQSNSLIKNNKEKELIKKNFFYVNVDGTILKGIKGFEIWCLERNFNIEKKAQEYSGVIKKYDRFKKGSLIDCTKKFKTTFKDVFVNKAFFVDFYAVEIFGKTRLGQMLLYAKQGQERKLMKELISEIKPKLVDFLKKEKIEAVGFVPPSVKREVQFMKVLEKELNLSLPIISILKTKTEITIPQKTLSKLEDRIRNAQKTFVVNENRNFGKILIIDDAIGSGATINELARKIKEQKIAAKVYGFSVTGSLKGFDVISEI
jgi:predicted amidophosphoribosyltransferase/DNA-binding transcriptional ArsR family regulator